jgi:phage terminase large subunit
MKNNPRRFRALYDGSFERMQGLVYDCFNEDENGIKSFNFPQGTRYYGGIDWGFADPFVLLVMAITPSGDHFIVSETYATELSPSDIEFAVESKMKIFPMLTIFCDPSQPGYIQMLHERGIPATKANNDILHGIAQVYELIKTRKLSFLEGHCKYTMDEMETYHYPEPKDLKPDQNAPLTKPVDVDNHAMDALRYVVMGTYLLTRPRLPSQPGNKHTKDLLPHERIARVKKPGRPNQYEKWN